MTTKTTWPSGYVTVANTLVYVIAWMTGLGGFYDRSFLISEKAAFGWTSSRPHRPVTLGRDLRRNAGLSQRELAELLDVPLNTFRMWDSGLRPVPCGMLERAGVSISKHARDTEPLSLDELAREFHVNERTPREAARMGRLAVHFLSRSVFGRPIRRATRQAAAAFMQRYYKQSYSRVPVRIDL